MALELGSHPKPTQIADALVEEGRICSRPPHSADQSTSATDLTVDASTAPQSVRRDPGSAGGFVGRVSDVRVTTWVDEP